MSLIFFYFWYFFYSDIFPIEKKVQCILQSNADVSEKNFGSDLDINMVSGKTLNFTIQSLKMKENLRILRPI